MLSVAIRGACRAVVICILPHIAPTGPSALRTARRRRTYSPLLNPRPSGVRALGIFCNYVALFVDFSLLCMQRI